MFLYIKTPLLSMVVTPCRRHASRVFLLPLGGVVEPPAVVLSFDRTSSLPLSRGRAYKTPHGAAWGFGKRTRRSVGRA